MDAVGSLSSYFLLCFTSLFTIINPFGAMTIYLSLTEGVSKVRSRRMAWRASVFGFSVLIVMAMVGKFIFDYFSISIDGLRIVGSILFFIMGFDMVSAKVVRTKQLSKDEIQKIEEAAITPLGIPVLCGPGAITIMTVMSQESENALQKIILIGACATVFFASYVILISSKQIMKKLGPSANKVFYRLMGLIIMMIAVEFFFKGITPYVRAVLGS